MPDQLGRCVQVELYADYEPGRLMSFLAASQAYGLEAAAELCAHRGLVREQVFVLGRMGNARQALHLIISQLADIPQVPAPSFQRPVCPVQRVAHHHTQLPGTLAGHSRSSSGMCLGS